MEFQSCAVCGRTILHGERAFDYVDAEGHEADVCPLCKPRAEASGWLPAEFAGEAPAPAPRRGGATALRERLSRAISSPPPDSAPPATPLEAFNASPEVRKVAGLRRSLGEPRVCVRAGDREQGELVVVAWDLCWYRWSVRGQTVKQLAKGNEVSELPLADRDWNATAAEDGTLRRA